jgi:hypothetical protein
VIDSLLIGLNVDITGTKYNQPAPAQRRVDEMLWFLHMGKDDDGLLSGG